MKFGIAMALAFLVVPGAAAQESPVELATPKGEEERSARLTDALTLVREGLNSNALDALNPLLVEYENVWSGEKRTLYCAENEAEIALYLRNAAAAKGKPRAAAIPSGWCIALWAKGYVLVDQGDSTNAVRFLERAVSMAPSHAHYLSELGYAYLELKQTEKALETYRRAAAGAELLADAAARQTALARAWTGVGFTQIQLDHQDAAVAAFRKVLEVDPENETAKAQLKQMAEAPAGKE